MDHNFDMATTCQAIRVAASQGSAISYDKLEEIHKIRKQPGYDRSFLFRHLGDVLRVSFQLGLPALTVVVVRDKSGKLDGNAIHGFADSADDAGYKFECKEKFASEQKEATFKWARDANAKLGGTSG